MSDYTLEGDDRALYRALKTGNYTIPGRDGRAVTIDDDVLRVAIGRVEDLGAWIRENATEASR